MLEPRWLKHPGFDGSQLVVVMEFGKDRSKNPGGLGLKLKKKFILKNFHWGRGGGGGYSFPA